mmetsp:Transcript_37410/g.119998  ORF Transcript_37410/g.119998 Transcript_37410/m.119998 type:complete len:382 (+) Transcript_37410:509-1654(+)
MVSFFFALLVIQQQQRETFGLQQPATLSKTVPELGALVGGTGRAATIWEALRRGVEPLLGGGEELSRPTRAALERAGITRFVPAETETASKAADGTTKLLVRLADGLAVETVLIPHAYKPRTTLCVSTQVGCDRGCRFCATATMGLRRNLTACEIAAQYFCAMPYADDTEKPLTNVVLFGMGDAGVNAENAAKAAEILTDDFRFGLAKAKVTASTVGPGPEAFRVLAKAPCALAWSVHSANDHLRRQLVPTHSRYSVKELRQFLIDALSLRPAKRTRTLMIAATLIAGVNDRDEDAAELAAFVGPLVDVAGKVNIDLIPVNAVDHAPHFRRPSEARVRRFLQVLRQVEPRIYVAVRTTRGDDENAACGQLLISSKARLQKR